MWRTTPLHFEQEQIMRLDLAKSLVATPQSAGGHWAHRRITRGSLTRRINMKDQVFRIEYFAVTVDDKLGAGGEFGNKLKQEGINLLALSAFPLSAGKTQLDLVPEHPDQLTKAAKKLGITLGSPKIAFLIQGTDRTGAMGGVLG